MNEYERRKQLAGMATRGVGWGFLNLILAGTGMVIGFVIAVWALLSIDTPLTLIGLLAFPLLGGWAGYALTQEIWAASAKR